MTSLYEVATRGHQNAFVFINVFFSLEAYVHFVFSENLVNLSHKITKVFMLTVQPKKFKQLFSAELLEETADKENSVHKRGACP